MKHTRRFLLALMVAVVSMVALNVQSASAVTYNQDWKMSRMIRRTYDNSVFTSGAWVQSRTNLHRYLVLPMHPFKSCWGCGYLGGTYRYEDSPTNTFDIWDLVTPTNAAYLYYDLVLVDFGVTSVPSTNAIHNYCTATNCTSYYGGGTQKNPNWAGSTSLQGGSAGSSAGWGIMAGKAISGTSWATIQGAHHVVSNGWDYWAIKATGVTGCGTTAGDSGAPWYTGNNGELLVGIEIGAPGGTSWTVPGPSPCYGNTVSISNQVLYIDWATIIAAYPGLSLVPVTVP